MSSWSKLYAEALNHPKTRRLARELGIPKLYALGVMSGLWCWSQGYAKDGDLGEWTPEDMADGMEWDGDSQALYDALVECRLIDNQPRAIHDWMQYQGSWKEALSKRDQRKKKRVPGQSLDSPRNVPRERRGEERKREESTYDDSRGESSPPIPSLLVAYEPKRVTTGSPIFERLWVFAGLHEVHVRVGGPGIGGKSAAWKKWREQKLDTKAEQVLRGLINYYQDCIAGNTFPKQVSRYLAKTMWPDWVDRQPRKSGQEVDPELADIAEAMSSGGHVCADDRMAAVPQGQKPKPGGDQGMGGAAQGIPARSGEASVPPVRGQRGGSRLEDSPRDPRGGDEDWDVGSTEEWTDAASVTQR